MGPKPLRHSPHRDPVALATVSAGDTLPAGDSADGGWGVWGQGGTKRGHQVLLAPGITPTITREIDQSTRQEILAPSLALRQQDSLTHHPETHCRMWSKARIMGLGVIKSSWNPSSALLSRSAIDNRASCCTWGHGASKEPAM